eukprot:1020026-Rhodomonas_salina.1
MKRLCSGWYKLVPSCSKPETFHGAAHFANRCAAPVEHAPPHLRCYNLQNTLRLLGLSCCDKAGFVNQAWLDARFPDVNHSWTVFTTAIVERYLPTDHDIRVELRFERFSKHTTLMDYVEQFQLVEAAMVLAKVHVSD